MKTRTLLMALALCLSLMLVVSGTLAYLTATDEDVNVMTLGGVAIEQLENGEAGFQDGTPLYPAYYGDEGFDWDDPSTITGVVEKTVTVENTGSSEAYVRTWFAFEAGEMSFDEFRENILLHLNDGEESVWTWAWDNTQTYSIENQDGEEADYFIAVATLREKLPAGETTDASLLQLAMCREADNSVVAAMGDYYTVLVFSQAMQTVNFEEKEPAEALAVGFGDAAVENGAVGVNHLWKDGFEQDYPVLPTKVKNLEELNAVVGIEQPGDAIFANDIDAGRLVGTTSNAPGPVGVTMNGGTIDGDGFSLTASSVSRGGVMIDPAGGTIRNLKIIGAADTSSFGIGSSQFAGSALTDDLILENVEIKEVSTALDFDANGHDVLVKDSTISGMIQIYNANSITFENCHFTREFSFPPQKEFLILLLDDMTFIDCHFEESVNFYQDNTKYGGTLIFNGCTYGNNGVADRPFEKSVGFFTWWMQPQHVVNHKGTFGEGNPASISFTCIVDGTTVWEAKK